MFLRDTHAAERRPAFDGETSGDLAVRMFAFRRIKVALRTRPEVVVDLPQEVTLHRPVVTKPEPAGALAGGSLSNPAGRFRDQAGWVRPAAPSPSQRRHPASSAAGRAHHPGPGRRSRPRP